ncbi:sterile alpha motif domain-containing protein 9-like [Astyanax mexicanus]|uniref:sterile alpha motif domain-containing protein 9-like n=1 Tax=Astyanax mexicanus TaxID=7994 RepID=UPI0020CAF8C6|nr:sterile alpha motif domain-containing protein 9-like [Astyanax mexicanus]
MAGEAAMADYNNHHIETWTKEHVHAWLCETVKIKPEYADIFIKEEVSGADLVCYEKQDLLEMGLQHGPAVRIMKRLTEHLSRPENTQSCKEETQPKQTKRENEAVSCATEMPSKRHQTQRAERSNQMASKVFTILLECLEELTEEHFKKFKRFLQQPLLSECSAVPESQLETKGKRMDIADLILEYHGQENGLKITHCILKKIPRNDLVQIFTEKVDQLQISTPDLKTEVKVETDHGEKLKNLLTCGASTLGHYSYFILVMNKADPEQLEHLQFLCNLDLFCVLDFDPNSNTNGACKLYTEFCHANLHFPAYFQSEPSAVVKKLNLYNQTSWVFCNGRLDLDSRHLDYQTWLKETHREIEQMVSFMFKPEVLPSRKCLVIFLLLSSVESEKDPIFDTFMTFHRQCGGEENIIHICNNEHTFDKWQSLIQNKYEFDIEKKSVYYLDLSQVYGKIVKLAPQSHPLARLLPSAGCSSVILKKKDEQRMNTLEILCENEYEGAYDEDSPGFHNLKLKDEEEFYRGGEVKWLNFYISEKQKAKPFIKRDKYEAVRTMVTSQIKMAKNTCVLVNLFHHPGCGGTTLAKHVMWELRKDLRCAVLSDISANEHVASQVMDLMKYGKSDASLQTPALLLVDNSKDTEAAEKLRNCIRRKIDKNCLVKKEKSFSSPVIILNCARTHLPKEQYTHCETDSQYITAELTKKEQDDFEEKLQELKENHKRPENFYSFMIMKSNFDKKYVKNIVSNILKDLDMQTKQAKLLSIMALLNSYIPESHISQSVCEDFLGMQPFLWGKETVIERMEPYSNLLIECRGGSYGEYSAIRILHYDIACACLDELDLTYNIKMSDITLDLLHCDLFFKTGIGKDDLILFIQRMLIERQRNVEHERETQFSLLIEKIHTDEGQQKVQEIFMKASTRYETMASIPQALARYLYLYEKDFLQALDWAENATKITENSFTVDTIGQIHKNYLKYQIEQEKEQEMSCSPDRLDSYIELAKKATNAFQRAQKLAKTENEPYEDCHVTKDTYNKSADMGVIEIALIIFDIISKLQFFDVKDPKWQLQSFLKGSISISNVDFEDNVVNQKYADILKKHEYFIHGLKQQAKTSFEFFERYFIYLKSRKFEEESGHRFRRKLSKHFKKYISFFTIEDELAQNLSTRFLQESMDIEDRKMFLEEQKADTFAGLLQHLEDRSGETMEKITECYTFLIEHSKSRHPKIITNLILANLILHLLNPKSKRILQERDLIHLLRQAMLEIRAQHPFPEPYYLALLLLWPSSSTTEIDENIVIYIKAIRSSSRHQLPNSLRRRGAISHIFLGKKPGLERLVPKAKLYYTNDPKESNRLWQSGDIFAQKDIKDRLLRVHGIVEQGEVYIEYGKLKIPVHPAFIDAVRTGFSTEKVTFYLGFAMTGPLAYDIQYEN